MRRQGTGHVSGNATVSHEIRVRFHDASGVEHEAELVSSDRDVLWQASEAKPLRIEYDPSNPRLIRREGSSAALFGNFILIPLAVGFVGMGVLFLAARRHLRQQSR